MKTSESVKNILPAIFKVKGEMKTFTKGASNPYFDSTYVDLNALLEGVEPLLAANGMILLQPVNGNTVETVILHSSGEFISSSMDMVLAKQDMQAAGSAVTYARRYSLQSLLGLKAVDDDGNLSSGKTVKPQQEAKKPAAASKKSNFKPKLNNNKVETPAPATAGSWS